MTATMTVQNYKNRKSHAADKQEYGFYYSPSNP